MVYVPRIIAPAAVVLFPVRGCAQTVRVAPSPSEWRVYRGTLVCPECGSGGWTSFFHGSTEMPRQIVISHLRVPSLTTVRISAQGLLLFLVAVSHTGEAAALDPYFEKAIGRI